VAAERLRAEDEADMIPFLRTVLYGCCMVIALMSAIAALTIAVAIVTNKLADPQSWMAVVFFAAVGAAAWIAGRAASIRSHPPDARDEGSDYMT
jgi:hypothetical protein